jgi:hypothetical protein
MTFFEAFIDELEKLAAPRHIKLVAKGEATPSSSYEIARAAAHGLGRTSAQHGRPSEVGRAARKVSREFGERLAACRGAYMVRAKPKKLLKKGVE